MYSSKLVLESGYPRTVCQLGPVVVRACFRSHTAEFSRIITGQERVKPANLKGNQPWPVIGRADDEAEAPVFWSSGVNSWLIGKVPDAGKDWGQKKRVSEDEVAGWHHGCNGHELGQALGDSEGQGGLACWSPRGCKGLDTTGHLNNCSKSRACVLNRF